jgi:hypothetical protein
MVLNFVRYKLKNGQILKGLQNSENKSSIYQHIHLGYSDGLTPIPKGSRKMKIQQSEKFDNSLQLLSFNNAQYKKIKQENKGYKVYITQMNGIESFAVHVNKSLKKVKIYARRRPYTYIYNAKDTPCKYDSSWQFTELIAEYNKFIRIFIGKNEVSSIGDGNTILIQITKTKYIFIEENISKFISTDQIKTFSSPVFNNDVPYPFAVGHKYLYYFAGNTKIKLELIPKDNHFWTNMPDFMYNREEIPQTSFKRTLLFTSYLKNK